MNGEKLSGDDARACLNLDREAGRNAFSNKQIIVYSEEASNINAAQFMLSHAPSCAAAIKLEKDYEFRPHIWTWIDRDLDGKDNILHLNAAAQRVCNNKLGDIKTIEVNELDSKPSRSKFSSVMVTERISDEYRSDETHYFKREL